MKLMEMATTEMMRVDRENLTLHSVRLVGLSSVNGRTYTPAALQEAIPLYENSPVYVDHDRQFANRNRSYRDLVGRVKNVRYENGLIGDIKLRKHELLETILFDAEDNTMGVGLSHNADGDGRKGVISKITKVNSIDLVANPATTKQLFEDIENEDEAQVEQKDEAMKLLEETNTRLNSEIKTLFEEIESLKTQVSRLNNSKAPLYRPAEATDEKSEHDQFLKRIQNRK